MLYEETQEAIRQLPNELQEEARKIAERPMELQRCEAAQILAQIKEVAAYAKVCGCAVDEIACCKVNHERFPQLLLENMRRMLETAKPTEQELCILYMYVVELKHHIKALCQQKER